MELGNIPWRRGATLFREAVGPREKFGVARYALQNARVRLGWGGGETVLRFGGVNYRVRVKGNEFFTCCEVVVDRAYERVPGFAAEVGDVVLDVGANIGIFGIRQARRGAQVLAFEPNPDAYSRLVWNVKANGLGGRVTTLPYALGDTQGRASLLRSYSTLVTQVIPDPTGDIEVRTLDDVVGQFGLERVHILKLDVEGSEAAVLRGGRNSLSRVGRVVMEYHGQELLEEVSNLLAQASFSRVRLEGAIAYFTGPGLVARSSR